ncbi:hypothetical protein CDO73_14750 [Saccharibacillus sp. O23]|uniref:ComEA family DNA-binding protein n=1 Tax=Saccharibacillus sp. O23 TaxID=2009338 RepID=UPI000B4E2229|nr:helix-hairpin-helix domain-containing protein [Saccharibacillus sp. O23]OWR29450.1 hypothetical protein CDO73_14750 [Saccharibacillus sp. O23]
MKKELLWAACISVVLGTGVLMSAGGSEPEGLPWQPLNEKLETALAVQEGTVEAAAEPAEKGNGGAKHDKSGGEEGSKPAKSQTGEAKAAASQTEKGETAAAETGRSGASASSEPQTEGADSDTSGEADATAEQTRQADSRSSDLPESAAAAPKAAESSPAPVEDGKIHLNSANAAQLMELPGIGEKKAQAILEYRDKNGPFREVTDIVKVKGIGPKMLEKMLPDLAL